MSCEKRLPKAAILTWCYNTGPTNYGQIIQCYAMQTIVQRLGYDTKLIRYRKRDANELLDLDNESEFSINLYELWYRLEKVERKINARILRFIQFVKENIEMSNQCYTKEQIEKECKDCSLLICGSDQIWNPQWFDDVYALNFGDESQIRIAYAASGVLIEDEPSEAIYKELGGYLECFDAISVREKDSIDILKKYTGKNIIDVPDPTLLLGQDEWNQVAAGQLEEEPYILCYSLGRLRIQKVLLKYIMLKHNVKKILFITSGFREEEDELETGHFFYSVKDAGPAEFIALIRDAEAVCTDSFHGLALSIIYQKQFYIFERYGINVNSIANTKRQRNLLDKVGIKEQRTVKCVKEIETLEAIDYSKVQLTQFKNELYGLIKNAL